jgi:hypothetical protein
VRRACLRFPQKTEEETFNEAFAKRSVRMRADEVSGMAVLSCSTVVTDALRADYRLTLIAKKRAEVAGEERTIEQLRADSLIDLVMGRLTVAASDGDLEDDSTGGGDGGDLGGGDPAASFAWHAVGKYARPIINVTVPITTLMGLDDTPGLQAGGIQIPAELMRRISGEPGSTWYRLLTDPAGGFVELSTEGYEPTQPIWRWSVAENPECIWPTCHRPATIVDLDHRVPHPDGPTSTRNLQPLCEQHHQVKHSQGFRVVREEDGSFTWTSRFGVTSRKPPPEYPGTEAAEAERRAEAENDAEAERQAEAEREAQVERQSSVERRGDDQVAGDDPAAGCGLSFVERHFADLIGVGSGVVQCDTWSWPSSRVTSPSSRWTRSSTPQTSACAAVAGSMVQSIGRVVLRSSRTAGGSCPTGPGCRPAKRWRPRRATFRRAG